MTDMIKTLSAPFSPFEKSGMWRTLHVSVSPEGHDWTVGGYHDFQGQAWDAFDAFVKQADEHTVAVIVVRCDGAIERRFDGENADVLREPIRINGDSGVRYA